MPQPSAQVGLWYDHDLKSPFSATITLPVDQGGYLIAGLATLVGLAATCSWILVSLILHQSQVKGADTTTIGLFPQVILRNSGSPLGTVWDLFKVWRAWSGDRTFAARIRPTVITAIIFWLWFTTAGVLVARIASKSYEDVKVLAGSGHCGFLTWDGPSLESLFIFNAHQLREARTAREYADSWYSDAPGNTIKSTFVIPRIQYTATNISQCPFNPASQCNGKTNEILEMDTGYLDSHKTFGINAAWEDRVQFRRVSTCTPVHVGIKIVNMELRDGNITSVAHIYAGPFNDDEYSMDYIVGSIYDLFGYSLKSLYAIAGDDGPWKPSPELNHTNADVRLFVLFQNSVTYYHPVSDSIFSANGTNKLATPDDMDPRYKANLTYPDYPVRAMACIDQLQVCNHDRTICSPFGGINTIERELYSQNYRPSEIATMIRLWSGSLINTISHSVDKMGASALLAQRNLMSLESYGLPDNQWQFEAQRWFETSLVILQSRIAAFPANVQNSNFSSIQSPQNFGLGSPVDDALASQCNNQRIRATSQYQNFSFLGVLLIVILSVVLIIAGLASEKVLELVRKLRGHATGYKQSARHADDKLELLRMTLEGVRYLNWVIGSRDVPVRGPFGNHADVIQRPRFVGTMVQYPQGP